MSDNFIVERYSTRIDRMGNLIRKAILTGNPLGEEMNESWMDLLDSIMEHQENDKKIVESLYALVRYMAETPNAK